MAKNTALAAYKAGVKARSTGKHHKPKMTIPLAIVGGFVPMGVDLVSAFRIGGIEATLGHVSLCTTGYDPSDGQWKPMFAAKKLYGPLLLGTIVHKVAGGLGINRMIAKSGIPIFRI